MNKQPDPEKWMRSVGANFHALRVARKMDIETVAEAVKISPALLEQIEKGEYNMELGLYVNLCYYYKVSLVDVATENKFTRPPRK